MLYDIKITGTEKILDNIKIIMFFMVVGFDINETKNSWFTERYVAVDDNIALNCNMISHVSEVNLRWLRQENGKLIVSGNDLNNE